MVVVRRGAFGRGSLLFVLMCASWARERFLWCHPALALIPPPFGRPAPCATNACPLIPKPNASDTNGRIPLGDRTRGASAKSG